MRVRVVVVCAVLFLMPIGASGQTAYQKSFSPQLFEPAIGVRNTFFAVEGAATPEHLAFGLGLFLNYQHRPLVLFRDSSAGVGSGAFELGSAPGVALVSSQLTADIYGALGLRYRWLKLQLGLAVPVNLWLAGNSVNEQGAAPQGFNTAGMGDLRIQIKGMIFENLAGFSLAFAPIFTVPTGCLVASGGLGSCDTEGSFGGDSNFGFRPRLAADFRHGKLLFAANIGGILRESAQIFSSEVGHRLTYGVAGGYQVHKRIFAMAEINGQAGFGTKSDCREDPLTHKPVCSATSSTDIDAFPLELDLGGHVDVGHELQLTIGGGVGLIKAIGSPLFRVMLGLRWAPDLRDSDGDGVLDKNDKCPTQKEDKDGFQDDDGCPDPDNDGDGIPDVKDKCPNEPEDKDGFQDDDGCPDPDNDGDGIPDLHDACPFQPETKNGFKDDDGCPDEPDQDGDGIPDAKDKCPKEPEDKDGFQDDDGCIDPDNDNDGIPDNLDDCPNDPEDKDGFKDDDGCPDPDNDNDGIPDVKDKCPNEPETINGYKDDDGCPDRGPVNVIIKKNKIIIVKKVFFATARAKIKRRSYSILDQVALTLKANLQIKWIQVEGHTDSRGNAANNRKLSQKRAQAVVDYLVAKGVDAKRLIAVGYGPDRPIESNRTRVGRGKNRRVEFTILDAAPVGAAPATAKPAPTIAKPAPASGAKPGRSKRAKRRTKPAAAGKTK